MIAIEGIVTDKKWIDKKGEFQIWCRREIDEEGECQIAKSGVEAGVQFAIAVAIAFSPITAPRQATKISCPTNQISMNIKTKLL